MKPVPFIRFVC